MPRLLVSASLFCASLVFANKVFALNMRDWPSHCILCMSGFEGPLGLKARHVGLSHALGILSRLLVTFQDSQGLSKGCESRLLPRLLGSFRGS